MIACVVDTISDEEILQELDKYRLFIFINSSSRATRLYSSIRKKVGGIEIKVKLSDPELLERIAVGIAKEFAEYKEPIHVWIGDKCIVY